MTAFDCFLRFAFPTTLSTVSASGSPGRSPGVAWSHGSSFMSRSRSSVAGRPRSSRQSPASLVRQLRAPPGRGSGYAATARREASACSPSTTKAGTRRAWLPHVTVLRFRERPRLRPELPDLGEVSPSEAAVYSSVLRPTGAQYEILESVPLGG